VQAVATEPKPIGAQVAGVDVSRHGVAIDCQNETPPRYARDGTGQRKPVARSLVPLGHRRDERQILEEVQDEAPTALCTRKLARINTDGPAAQHAFVERGCRDSRITCSGHGQDDGSD